MKCLLDWTGSLAVDSDVPVFACFHTQETFGPIHGDKTVLPKSANDLKLIHAGKVLEKNKTLADSRITYVDLPGGVITVHIVVQPCAAKKMDKEPGDLKK